jgi:hypothetical protein
MTNDKPNLLMDVLFFLGRFHITEYEIENIGMDTATGESRHTMTIQLKQRKGDD